MKVNAELLIMAASMHKKIMDKKMIGKFRLIIDIRFSSHA